MAKVETTTSLAANDVSTPTLIFQSKPSGRKIGSTSRPARPANEYASASCAPACSAVTLPEVAAYSGRNQTRDRFMEMGRFPARLHVSDGLCGRIGYISVLHSTGILTRAESARTCPQRACPGMKPQTRTARSVQTSSNHCPKQINSHTCPKTTQRPEKLNRRRFVDVVIFCRTR